MIFFPCHVSFYHIKLNFFSFQSIWYSTEKVILAGSFVSFIVILHADFKELLDPKKTLFCLSIALSLTFPLHIQNLGKGSLWMVDPAYRPNLLQALSKTPFHPYSNLDRIYMVSTKAAYNNRPVLYRWVRGKIQPHYIIGVVCGFLYLLLCVSLCFSQFGYFSADLALGFMIAEFCLASVMYIYLFSGCRCWSKCCKERINGKTWMHQEQLITKLFYHVFCAHQALTQSLSHQVYNNFSS